MRAAVSVHANATLNQTMLRVKDPVKSLEFYTNQLKLHLLEKKVFSDFTLYFLVNSTPEVAGLSPGTEASNEYLKSGSYGCCLELTHNHGTETQPDFSYHNGNTEPLGAFGHLGFLLPDISSFTGPSLLPEESNWNAGLKGVSVKDPDGYYVHLWESKSQIAPSVFHHTMLKVTSMEKSLDFYHAGIGMNLMAQCTTPEYKSSLLATDKTNAQDVTHYTKGMLELRQVLGESAPTSYVNGNTEPARGFGHIALMVDDVYVSCDDLEESGATFQKKPNEGRMKGLAFVKDVDGYWIEIVGRLVNVPKSVEEK